ncbi:MAG: hypothetical protein QOF91_1168 [Alphaproteobacteria bacterium]|jgi:hypothetical protein|nr:hypothetical protein [Alphaproteobacteria bacterium]
MAGQGSPAADKLRAFLQGLKPGSRALLIAELERGLLQGTGSAGAEFVLAELRRSLRDGQSKASRFGDPARLFFQPVEPFLVDDGPDHKHRGRIARSALEPLWLWIGNTLMPEEAKGYADRVEHALMAGDSDKAEHQARNFQDLTVVRITQMLDSADDRDYRRLNVQLGTSRALDDVQALRGILNSRDRLAMLGTHLPGHINSLAGPVLESVKAQIDSPLGGESDMFVYSLVLVMSKLASPWQLIRLAIKAAGSDDAKRIGETSYAVAVEIVLEEADRRVRELAADLKSGRGIAVAALLKEVHDTLRGLRSEINLSPESVWGKQLTALRAQVSKVLTGEVELMPGRVRRLIRPRPSKEIAPGSRLDTDEVTETEALIGFVAACRNYASELAINEVTQRTFNELQQLLDSGTRTLLDGLRGARSGERPFRQSQIDAAVRFCAKVFGQEYASLLTKAAEVASHDQERKIPAQA